MTTYYTIFYFILGAILASFFTVVATRLPVGKSIVKPKSHCPECNHPLKWYELIPIVSFIFLRGKCHYCKKRIGLETIVSEISLGIMFVISYLTFNNSYELILSFCLDSLLLLIFVSDIKYMIILDSPLVISSIIIFIVKWIYLGINEALMSVLSGIGLFFIMLGIGKLGEFLFKREALGGGDIKLSFVMGLLLNIPLGLTALVLSTFLALPYATFSMLSNNEHEVAFGPFLIAATYVVFMFADKFKMLINLYFWL